MTARPILARWERVRATLPTKRQSGRLSFWIACLYLTECPVTANELANRMSLTSVQCNHYLQLMERSGLASHIKEGFRDRTHRYFATPKLFNFLKIEEPSAE